MGGYQVENILRLSFLFAFLPERDCHYVSFLSIGQNLNKYCYYQLMDIFSCQCQEIVIFNVFIVKILDLIYHIHPPKMKDSLWVHPRCRFYHLLEYLGESQFKSTKHQKLNVIIVTANIYYLEPKKKKDFSGISVQN